MDPKVMSSLVSAVKDFIATTSVPASALRNQGGPGVIDCVRDYLKGFDLSCLTTTTSESFVQILDKETDLLAVSFPVEGLRWGAARKAINLFLRDSFYNFYLRERYELWKIEALLEVPLDSIVGNRLRKIAGHMKLSVWPGLKYLNKVESDRYQSYASELASTIGLARVHLDAYLWTKYR